MLRFEMAAKTAKKIGANWTNGEIVAFHFHNDNGLVAKKLRFDNEVRNAVKAGLCNASAMIAYGSLNDAEAALHKLMGKKRISGSDLSYALTSLQCSIRATKMFLETLPTAVEA